jgi:hypothetical protein
VAEISHISREDVLQWFPFTEGAAREYRIPKRSLLRPYRERPSDRAAERSYQFPPADVDWHVTLPCEGLPKKDTTR